MKGVLGYGRYDDAPDHIGCPRAKTDMTPCIARDGRLALDDTGECVGCGKKPVPLLRELTLEAGQPVTPEFQKGDLEVGAKKGAEVTADMLRDLVRQVTS